VCGRQVKLCDPLVTHGPYTSALETRHNKAIKVLYKFTFFILLLYKAILRPTKSALGLGLHAVNHGLGLAALILVLVLSDKFVLVPITDIPTSYNATKSVPVLPERTLFYLAWPSLI